MLGFLRKQSEAPSARPLRIGFYQPHLDIRGTGVSVYEYAKYNETILGNKSVVFCDKNDPRTHPLAADKFRSGLSVVVLNGSEDMRELRAATRSERIDALYIQKCGRKNDGRYLSCLPLLIHVVGLDCDPHGRANAYTSRWGAAAIGKGQYPWVPYPVAMPQTDANLRAFLKIPPDATVFGRLGGLKSWDMPWVNDVVEDVLSTNEKTFFLAALTPRFTNHPRAIFLDAFADLHFKRKFINTCNAMLHARSYGETFGMAVAEFSFCGRPVITYGKSEQRAHLDFLGEKAVIFEDKDQLRDLLIGWSHPTGPQWNANTEFTPQKVMERFKSVFLDQL